MVRILATLLAVLAIAGCKLPLDPEDTLARVEAGTLRVGLVEPSATERARVKAFAADLHAELLVVPGSEHVLVKALENGDLDVIAPLPPATPYAQRVGLSRPYGRDGAERAWAVRAGENGFLMVVNRYLANTPPGR